MKEKKGAIVLGIGAVTGLLFLLLRKIIPSIGFTMSIKNAPASAYQWYGSLGTPETSSGWLAIDETWRYPNDPGGAYAFVSVIDYDLQQIVFAQNLGPIMKGKNYIFDCATGQLLS